MGQSEGDRLIEYLDFAHANMKSAEKRREAQRTKPPPAQLEDRTSLAFSMCVSHAFVAFSSFSFFHSSFFLSHRCRCRFMLCWPKQSPPHSGCLCDYVCVRVWLLFVFVQQPSNICSCVLYKNNVQM